MKTLSHKLKSAFGKTFTVTTGKIMVSMVGTVLLTALLTVLVYQTILIKHRENTPQFLGGWYLDSDIETFDDEIPYGFDFRGDGVVNIKCSNGDEVTCSYVCSPKDRSLTILNYYGKDISFGYSIQPLIHFWSDSENGWDADYLFAG